jgi:CheY-like chemotaxis protein
VLVVDDNVDTAVGVSKLLKLLGHDVRIAHDGHTAVEVARSHNPEVVLLDIGLPGMDGYEVVKRLRAEECCKRALIIAVSGYGQEEDIRRSRGAGFDHHLIKPVDFDALMSLLSGHVSG